MHKNGVDTEPFAWTFPVEILAVLLVFYLDKIGMIPLSKTPFLVLIGWVSLSIRGTSWRARGLVAPPEWLRLFSLGCLAGIAFWIFEYFVENPVLHALTGRYPDLSIFSELVGNVQLLAILLAANIILAGIGEEMAWRGYALPRVAEVLGTRWNWIIANLLISALFGLAHVYQGESGAIQAAVQGFLLGMLYLQTGRNLIAPICAHTVSNTCDFLLIFSGNHVGTTGDFPF